jgi:DNA-binding XRE family transcriptional regulator
MNNINNNIKNYRIKKEMTQQDLSDKLYVTRQCVSSWEQGKTLPNIESIENIATILECSINDLIDDNSVKTIAIEQVLNNKKKTRYIWLSLIVSLVAILLTVFSLIYPNRNVDNDLLTLTIYVDYGYIENIDTENGVIYFKNIVNDTELPLFNYEEMNSTIFDNRGDIINIEDLRLNDIVRLRYELDDPYLDITVLDSEINESLYGVYVSTTGENYSTLAEIQNATSGVNYLENQHKIDVTASYHFGFIHDVYYQEEIYDIYLSLNPLYLDHEIEIGLITSSGLRILESIDMQDMQDVYTYSGEYEIDSTETDYVNSIDVTYNIHVDWEFPYTSIEVFEYDENGNLLDKQIITTLLELRGFEVNENALRCLVKVNTTILTSTGNKEEASVYLLLLGEQMEVFYSDEYGFVSNELFSYK